MPKQCGIPSKYPITSYAHLVSFSNIIDGYLERIFTVYISLMYCYSNVAIEA